MKDEKLREIGKEALQKIYEEAEPSADFRQDYLNADP